MSMRFIKWDAIVRQTGDILRAIADGQDAQATRREQPDSLEALRRELHAAQHAAGGAVALADALTARRAELQAHIIRRESAFRAAALEVATESPEGEALFRRALAGEIPFREAWERLRVIMHAEATSEFEGDRIFEGAEDGNG